MFHKGLLMKALLATIVIMSLAVYAVYHFGLRGFDPAAQAEAFRAKVVPGTPWQDVVAVAPPFEWCRLYTDNDGVGGKSIGVKYKQNDFAAMIQKDGPGEGFVLCYNFSADHVYDVYFDDKGKVEEIVEPATFSKLVTGGH
jgi:hypothetical protein